MRFAGASLSLAALLVCSVSPELQGMPPLTERAAEPRNSAKNVGEGESKLLADELGQGYSEAQAGKEWPRATGGFAGNS
jgi:hypothetical protein